MSQQNPAPGADYFRVLCALDSIVSVQHPRVHQDGDVYLYRGPVLVRVMGASVAVDDGPPDARMVDLMAHGDDMRTVTPGLRARLAEHLDCGCDGTRRRTCETCGGAGKAEHDCGCPHCPPGLYGCHACDGSGWEPCWRRRPVRLASEVIDAHMLHAMLPEEPTGWAVRTVPGTQPMVMALVAFGAGWVAAVCETRDVPLLEVSL